MEERARFISMKKNRKDLKLQHQEPRHHSCANIKNQQHGLTSGFCLCYFSMVDGKISYKERLELFSPDWRNVHSECGLWVSNKGQADGLLQIEGGKEARGQ